ncbi:MAG: hopanoid biosynthesis-associated protein HpnK [Desulfuromonadales bacterium]
MKRLIITADDFGFSSGVNRAVEQGWKSGLLTCASIMAGGSAFDEAAKISRRNPELQVGLHLTLVQGCAVLPPAKIPDLVDSDGNFTDKPVRAGFRYFLDRGLYCQLKREIEAQIVKVRDAGIQLTHIDGHLNIHLHPTIFRILVELMPGYGISTFRLAQERLAHNLRFDKGRKFGKSVESLIFRFLTDHARPELDRLGIKYAAEVKGVLNSGRMTEDYLLNIIDDIQDGLSEMYFHPGVLPDAGISCRMPGYHHQEELAAITSPKLAGRLQELQIRVQNYRGDVKC